MFNSQRSLFCYYLLETVSAFAFSLIATVYIVYWSVIVGLDPFQIMLVASVFEATIFLFEVPTGVLADTYSRRLSILLGLFLLGMGFLVQGLFPVFAVVLMAEVVAGIGVTFTSGATEAWIAEEIGDEQAGKAFMRAGQLKTIGSMVGIIASVALASVQLYLPVIAAGFLLVGLAAFLVFTMPERDYKRAATGKPQPITTLMTGLRYIRVRSVLIITLAVQFVFAFHTEGLDQLWQQHFLLDLALPDLGALKPVVWFGVISFGANIISLILNEAARRDGVQNPVRVMSALTVVMVGGILVFALAQEFWLAVVAFWMVTAVRQVIEPLSKAWLNQQLEPENRATMFSVSGQVNSIGEIIGGPPVGAIATLFSVPMALATAGVILALTLPLYALMQKRELVKVEE